MDVRHGFSAVPSWPVKGALGVALAAAVMAGVLVAPSPAAAAPRDGAAAEAAGPARRSDGGLEAPDIASARTIAALEGEQVEVVGERTPTSSTWVNPDGTLTQGQAPAPVWVRTGAGDGTTSADWAAVDLALEKKDDGSIAPKAHPADLVLAGAGVPASGAWLGMTGGDGRSVGLQWTDRLPEPRLEGPRAVYPDARPGMDLVIEATPSGYEQFFVLTKKPAAGAKPDLSLTVTADGLAAETTPEGGVAFRDPSGEVVAASGTPQVWDAAVDGERQHPITEPRTDEGTRLSLAPRPEWKSAKRDAGARGVSAAMRPSGDVNLRDDVRRNA